MLQDLIGFELSGSVVSNSSQSSPVLFADSFGAKGDNSTDDTTAWNNAFAAANAIGSTLGARCELRGTPGKTYAVSSITAQSYVHLVGGGWAFSRKSGVNPLINAVSVTELGMERLMFAPGTGSETGASVPIWVQQSTYVDILGCSASNLGQAACYLVDSQWVWVLRNRFPNVGLVTGGTNGINLVNGGNGNTIPLKHVWCGHNFVSGNTVQIEIVASGTPTRTDPDMDAHIFHNTAINLSTGKAWPMGIEQGATSPAISGIEFTGNNCYQLNSFNGVGSRTYGFVISSPVTNPTNISGVSITGGRIVSNASGTNRGILVESSDTTITGVDIEAGEIDIVWQGAGGGNLTKLAVLGCQSHSGTGTQVQLGANTDGTTFSMKGGPPVGAVTVAVPSTTNSVAAAPYDRTFYITNGTATLTLAIQSGPTITVPASALATVELVAGRTMTYTYASGAPTQVVEGH